MKYEKSNRWVNDLKTESELTSLEIQDDSKGKDICLLFSGGSYSEFVAKSFLRMDIPFRALTCHHQYNTKDFEKSKKFCNENNIEQEIVEIDADDFDYKRYTDKISSLSKNQSIHCHLYENANGFPVMGNGFLWVRFSTFYKEYNIINKENWEYIDKWKKILNKPGASMFFRYNPEIVLSQLFEFLKIAKVVAKKTHIFEGTDINLQEYFNSHKLKKIIFEKYGIDVINEKDPLSNKYNDNDNDNKEQIIKLVDFVEIVTNDNQKKYVRNLLKDIL